MYCMWSCDEGYGRVVLGSGGVSSWSALRNADETVRHPDQRMRGNISWGKLLPFLMHASQGGVMSGVILSGVTIEYHVNRLCSPTHR